MKKNVWKVLLMGFFFLPFFAAEIYKAFAFSIYVFCTIWFIYMALSSGYFLKQKRIAIPLFFWLLNGLIASIYAINPQLAVERAGVVFFGGLAFFVVSGLDWEHKKQLGFILITSSLAISFIGILDYFLLFSMEDHQLASQELLFLSEMIQRRRVYAVFFTPNILAVYLAMINCLAIAYFFIQKNQIFRFFFLCVLTLNTYVLWLTRSITGMASFGVGIFLFGALAAKYFSPTYKKFYRVWLFSFLSVFSLFIALILNRIFCSQGIDNLFLSLRNRIEFWKVAVYLIAEHPLGFSGLGGFGFFFKSYAPYTHLISTMAHNIFFQIWVEMGICGLLAFIWFFLVMIHRGLKDIQENFFNDKTSIVSVGALSAVGAFLFHNLFDFSFFVSQTAIIWWILCAFIVNNSLKPNR